jgi:hypothetical protein
VSRFASLAVASFLPVRQHGVAAMLKVAWASILATQMAAHTGSWLPLLLIVLFVFDRLEQYRGISCEELQYSYKEQIEAGILKGDQLETEFVGEV